MSRKGKLERVMVKLYGDREWTPEEVSFGKRAIGIAGEESKRSRMPRRDVRIGEECWIRGEGYRVVRRPQVLPSEACSGCAFRCGPCPAARCSKFDRADGVSVWFVRAEGAEG